MKARSTRFVVTLAALLFLGLIVLSEVSTAALPLVVQGTADATDYQIWGRATVVKNGPSYDMEYLCKDCYVRTTVEESNIVVAGSGEVTTPPPYRTYEIGVFQGRIGIEDQGLHDLTIHLDGTTSGFRSS